MELGGNPAPAPFPTVWFEVRVLPGPSHSIGLVSILYGLVEAIAPRTAPDSIPAVANHHAAALRNNDVAGHPGQTWS